MYAVLTYAEHDSVTTGVPGGVDVTTDLGCGCTRVLTLAHSHTCLTLFIFVANTQSLLINVMGHQANGHLPCDYTREGEGERGEQKMTVCTNVNVCVCVRGWVGGL